MFAITTVLSTLFNAVFGKGLVSEPATCYLLSCDKNDVRKTCVTQSCIALISHERSGLVSKTKIEPSGFNLCFTYHSFKLGLFLNFVSNQR